MAAFSCSRPCSAVSPSASPAAQYAARHNTPSPCAPTYSSPPAFCSPFSSSVPRGRPELSRCSTAGSSAPSRSPKRWGADSSLCQPSNSGSRTPQHNAHDFNRGRPTEGHLPRHSSSAPLDTSRRTALSNAVSLYSASGARSVSPPLALMPSAPALQLAGVNAAFCTHTPHTVLFLPPRVFSNGSDTHKRQPRSFQSRFPSASVGGLSEEDQRFSSVSSPLLLACVGRCVLISALGEEVETFCSAARRPSAGADMLSSVPPSVSRSPPPRQYDVHTAPVTTLSFCHSLGLVCSTQRAASAHATHFASLWCPYAVEERARLALSVAPRAEVVCCSFLPREGGLLVLLKDTKYTLLGFMNLYELLRSRAAFKERHLECPHSSTHTSPRAPTADIEKRQTSYYSPEPPSRRLSQGGGVPAACGRKEAVQLSASVPLLTPSFVAECGRAVLHGLAVEPPLHGSVGSCYSWSTSLSSVSSASRFATFGSGHLRLWTLGPKSRLTEKRKSTDRPGLARLHSGPSPSDFSFPSPSFRSCSFGPGFLSQHARTAAAAGDATVYAPRQSSLAAPGFGTSFPLGERLSRGVSTLSSHKQGTTPTVTACAFLPDSRELIAGTSEGLIYIFRGLTAIRAVAAPSVKGFFSCGSRVLVILPLRKNLLLVATREGTVSLLYTHAAPARGSRREVEMNRRVEGETRRPASSGARTLASRRTPYGTPKILTVGVEERTKHSFARPQSQREATLFEKPGKHGATRRTCRPRRKSRLPRGLTHSSSILTRVDTGATDTGSPIPGNHSSLCPKNSFGCYRASLTSSRRPPSRRWISPAPFAERLLDRPVHTPRSSYAAAYGRPDSCRKTGSRSCSAVRRRGSTAKADFCKAGEERGYLLHCDNATATPDPPGGIRELPSSRQPKDTNNSGKLQAQPDWRPWSTSCVLSEPEWKHLQDDTEGSGFLINDVDPDVSRVNAGTVADGASRRGNLHAKRVIELSDVLRLHSALCASRANPSVACAREDNDNSERDPHSETPRHAACPSLGCGHFASRRSSCGDSCHGRRGGGGEKHMKNASLLPLPRENYQQIWIPTQAAQIVGWAMPSPAEMQQNPQPKYLIFVTESHVILLCVDQLCPEKSLILAQKPWGSVDTAASAALASAIPPALYRKAAFSQSGNRNADVSPASSSPWLLQGDFSPCPAGLSSGNGYSEEGRGTRMSAESRGGGRDGGCEGASSREARDDFSEIKRREEAGARLGDIIATGGRCAVGGALQLWRVTPEGKFEAIGERKSEFVAGAKHVRC